MIEISFYLTHYLDYCHSVIVIVLDNTKEPEILSHQSLLLNTVVQPIGFILTCCPRFSHSGGSLNV
jgi:hypothetical protein